MSEVETIQAVVPPILSDRLSEAHPTVAFTDQRALKRVLLEEQQNRWAQGIPLTPEELQKRWPGDPRQDPDFACVLHEDLRFRREQGDDANVANYVERFPEQKDALTQRVSLQIVFDALGAAGRGRKSTLRLPEVGEELFGFRLRSELGRGAFARVFLAEQAELAGRPVALKVSEIKGTEPQTLAQLQHTNIVPIYSVHENEHAGLRAVCMPYFGGTSLFQILKQLWRGKAPPTQGRELFDALLRTRMVSESWEPENQQSPLYFLSAESYIGAVAWIVARLAEGLQHAHQRGVLHRDIKPANVLISSDGQPMLLDFNLSVDPKTDEAEAVLGGTAAYMSPEHLHALLGRDRALYLKVDRRSDVYSLGMVLFEMLTGQRPFEQSASYSAMPSQVKAMAAERGKTTPSVIDQTPTVPWSLESIVRKCLTPDPARRYQQAEHLAQDLRCFLEDRPLKYAPELSSVEQVQKWGRRHPRLTSIGVVSTVAIVLMAAVGVVLASTRSHLADAHVQLDKAEDRKRIQDFESGTPTALCLVNTTLDLQDHLRQGENVCVKTLGLYGVLDNDNWQQAPEWVRLPAADRQRLGDDVRELLLLLASARVRQAPKDAEALHGALRLLDRADAVIDATPLRAIWLDRAGYLEQLGENDRAAEARQRAEQIPLASARDHYQLATSLARLGGQENCARAIDELNVALQLDRRHYWSWMQRGLCHTEMGELVLAAEDFGNCTGLWPEFSWGYFNQGYVLDQSGRKTEAVDRYTQALERDSALTAAYVNRGLARLELERHRQALADFDRAIADGSDDSSLQLSRGMALEGLGRHAEADKSFQQAFALARVATESARQRLKWAYGFAVAKRLPQQAQEAFAEVLRQDPNNTKALYGQAMLAANDDDSTEAIRLFDLALNASPNFCEARRYRAVLLARQGALDLAANDINWCLEKEPRSGPSLYAAACVASLAAQKYADSSLATHSLDLLAKAHASGVPIEKAKVDPDLAEIRKLPRFAHVLGQATRDAGAKSTANVP